MGSNSITYKALIIDDERLARKELLNMLNDYEQIVAVGEAEDVPSAIAAIEELHPDIVFLDIQMPGQSGFDLLDQIDYEGEIIFVTAFDEYAIRAFEVNALDYLLKPISDERLQTAIERIGSESKETNEISKTLTANDWLFLRYGNKTRFIKVDSIIAIEASADYSMVYLDDGSRGLVSKSMKEWEERLPQSFLRIHRSTIIQINNVEKVEEWYNYSYRVYMKHIDEPYTLSRRFAKKLKDKFS